MYENVYMVIEWRSSIPFSNKKISTFLRSYEYARTYIAETHDIDVSQSYHFSRKKENCAIFEKVLVRRESESVKSFIQVQTNVT